MVTRSRRGTPQLELSEQSQQLARSGEGPGFDLEGAAAEIARVAGERPGLMLNRARVTKLLSGFPTFTTSGARPFMGHTTYRNFIRALVELRSDLRLMPTPDGGVAVVYGVGAGEAPAQAAAAEPDPPSRQAEPSEGKRAEEASPVMLPGAAAAVKG